MSRNWKGGSTTKWRKTRAQILLNNQVFNAGQCTLQIKGKCTGIANQVHHTLGRGVTGDDPRYLQAVCAACNYAIGDPTKNRDPRGRPPRW